MPMNTVILTDAPDQLSEFFPATPAWKQAEPTSLGPTLQNLWTAIGTGGSPWISNAPDSFNAGGWDAIAIIDRAPGSQFDALHEASARNAGLPASTACLALRGRGFHGNRARPWSVEKGNLHLTTHHNCNIPVSRARLGFSMLPTVAATRALAGQAGKPGHIGIKWVNDILIEGQKVAGSLTSTQIQDEAYTSVVMGLGMNVERTPPIDASRFVPAAGCLADLLPVSCLTLPEVLPKVLRAFDDAYRKLIDEGQDELLDAYRRFSCCIGEEVTVWAENVSDFASAEPLAQGRLLKINDDLSLTIEGHHAPVDKGRLAFTNKSWPMGTARIAD